MPRFVALLRGVNVGGRKLAMDDLRALLGTLGLTDVRTYIQSGNVVFGAPRSRPATLRASIERAIAADLALDVTVLLRTPAELAEVIETNPYGAGAYVTFLEAKPDRRLVAALDPAAYAPDVFTVVDREVYVRCANGYGRTKINNTYFERKLATRATTRNWNTVTTLYDWATA